MKKEVIALKIHSRVFKLLGKDLVTGNIVTIIKLAKKYL